MASVTVTTSMSATPAEVWALLTKINRYPKWDAFADEIVAADRSRLKAGSTYEVRTAMDRSRWHVDVFEEPDRMVHIGTVGFLGKVRREFAVVGTGNGAAQLRQTIGVTVMAGVTRPFGWLAEKLFVERMLRQRMTQSGKALRDLLAAEN